MVLRAIVDIKVSGNYLLGFHSRILVFLLMIVVYVHCLIMAAEGVPMLKHLELYTQNDAPVRMRCCLNSTPLHCWRVDIKDAKGAVEEDAVVCMVSQVNRTVPKITPTTYRS